MLILKTKSHVQNALVRSNSNKKYLKFNEARVGVASPSLPSNLLLWVKIILLVVKD
jgi:hypothetical protein